jgi:hypothetical protein
MHLRLDTNFGNSQQCATTRYRDTALKYSRFTDLCGIALIQPRCPDELTVQELQFGRARRCQVPSGPITNPFQIFLKTDSVVSNSASVCETVRKCHDA